jgi:hypothetical protein
MATDERTWLSSANLLIERISGSASLTVKRYPRVILIFPYVGPVFMADSATPERIGVKNQHLINIEDVSSLEQEERLENVLRRAKGAGVQFDQENEKDLERLAELQDLLNDAERERTCLWQEGDDTALHDEVISKTRQEIRALSEKIK